MSSTIRNLIITVATSTAVGVLGTAIIASSESGYAAGFIVLPILLVEGVICLLLFLSSFIWFFQNKFFGLYLLLAAILIPTTTITAAMLAKEFQIGAYREEPMQPFPIR